MVPSITVRGTACLLVNAMCNVIMGQWDVTADISESWYTCRFGMLRHFACLPWKLKMWVVVTTADFSWQGCFPNARRSSLIGSKTRKSRSTPHAPTSCPTLFSVHLSLFYNPYITHSPLHSLTMPSPPPSPVPWCVHSTLNFQ
jgi:hypothetical protein